MGEGCVGETKGAELTLAFTKGINISVHAPFISHFSILHFAFLPPIDGEFVFSVKAANSII